MEDWVHRNTEMFEATLLRIHRTPQTFDDFLHNALLFQCWYRSNERGAFSRIEMKFARHVSPNSNVNIREMMNVDKLRKVWNRESARLSAKMGDKLLGLGLFILQAVEINGEPASNLLPPLRVGNGSYFLPFLVNLTSDSRRIVNITENWLEIFLSHSDALRVSSSLRLE